MYEKETVFIGMHREDVDIEVYRSTFYVVYNHVGERY